MIVLLFIPLFACLIIYFIANLLRRKWILFILTFLLLVLVNLYAEIISCGRLLKTSDVKSNIMVLTYNVHSSCESYSEKQEAISKIIIAESPDITIFAKGMSCEQKRQIQYMRA